MTSQKSAFDQWPSNGEIAKSKDRITEGYPFSCHMVYIHIRDGKTRSVYRHTMKQEKKRARVHKNPQSRSDNLEIGKNGAKTYVYI
jgi:hypothetical protein